MHFILHLKKEKYHGGLYDPTSPTVLWSETPTRLLQEPLPVSFAARSISEEFSSGDARNRDNGEPGPGSTHSRDPRSPKDKEDKERGDEGISICFM